MNKKIKKTYTKKRMKNRNYKKAIVGFVAGIICGFFSSGGGLILVPAFIYIFKIEDKQARATATACILPMVAISGIFYFKLNYINLKYGILCAIGGIVGGITGSKLLKIIPTKYIRILFIVFLFYVSIKMLIG